MQFGPFVFDRGRQLLAREGREVPLPPRVLGVLDVLSARPGQIVSKQELIETVWKDAYVSDTSLAEAVSFLRQALGDDPQQPSYIQTVHRRGYRFLPPSPVPVPAAVAAAQPAAASPGSTDTWGVLLPWAIVVLLGATTASTVWRLARPGTTALLPVARFEVAMPDGAVLDTRAPAVAMSADGSRIAFSACGADGNAGCRIYTRALDDTHARPIAGTEGGTAPFLSPDGSLVGFFTDGKLKKIAVAGGSPSTVADVREPLGGAWLDDGSLVFSASANGGPGALLRVGSGGGAPQAIGAIGSDIAVAWPDPLPDGRTVLATAITAPGDRPRTRIVAVSLATGQRTTVFEGAAFARFVPPSMIAFVHDAQLMAAVFDPSQSKVTGQPVAVGWAVGGRAPQFAVSRVGTFAAAPLVDSPSGAGPALAWMSRDGPGSNIAPLPSAFQQMRSPSLSSDGRRIAALTFDAGRADVWTGDLARGTVGRVTFDGDHRAPIWAANDNALVFASAVAGTFNVFERPANASTAARIAASARHQLPASVSRDGRVAYTEFDPASGADIWIGASDGRPSALVRTPFDETAPAFSPDGRWVAYQSNESNQWEVYARPFPGTGAALAISAGGGSSPVWSRDGRTLFYAGANAVMAVEVAGCAAEPCDLKPSAPRMIARGPWIPRGTTSTGLLLVERIADTNVSDRLTLTLQWTRELQRIVPPAVVTTPK
jgi:eukaryotic-like serine/threonine-protein kinase